jgi:hypothetical protein
MPFRFCNGEFNFRYLCFIFISMWPSMHIILTSWKFPPMKNLQQIFIFAFHEHKWWPINDQFWVLKCEPLLNTHVFTLQIWQSYIIHICFQDMRMRQLSSIVISSLFDV